MIRKGRRQRAERDAESIEKLLVLCVDSLGVIVAGHELDLVIE